MAIVTPSDACNAYWSYTIGSGCDNTRWDSTVSARRGRDMQIVAGLCPAAVMPLTRVLTSLSSNHRHIQVEEVESLGGGDGNVMAIRDGEETR